MYMSNDSAVPDSRVPVTGAEIVVRCLAEEGVKHVFGYPGGAVLYIYDAIFNQDKFQHVLVRHEQAAVHAADAYSRSSQTVGVAIVTSGPGVTNAVTGLSTAYMDSVPMVVISGQVPSHAIGQDAFQECDTVGITRPVVKHNFLVKDVRELASTIKKAFFIARTGRPGPVLVDIPKDITVNKCLYEYPREIEMRSYRPVDKGHAGQIRKAVALLQNAERPMIYAGGGVILANASNELNRMVDKLGFPITNTLMGLGASRSSSPHFVGMPGMHGTYEANMAMQHCFASAQDHPHRYRPVVDFQAREGRHPDRRQRQGRAGRTAVAAGSRQRAAERAGAAGLVEADRRMARPRLPQVRRFRHADQTAIGDRAIAPRD